MEIKIARMLHYSPYPVKSPYKFKIFVMGIFYLKEENNSISCKPQNNLKLAKPTFQLKFMVIKPDVKV